MLNRCFVQLEYETSGGPGRFLPSAIMLDHPGQRLKLPDGPSVEPRRLSEYFLRNMEIDDRISSFVIVNFSIFLGADEMHKL